MVLAHLCFRRRLVEASFALVSHGVVRWPSASLGGSLVGRPRLFPANLFRELWASLDAVLDMGAGPVNFNRKLDQILSGVETTPSYPLGRDLTIGHDKTECDLKNAKTGQPFECIAYRGQVRSIDDPSRGVFWTPYPLVAYGYATQRGAYDSTHGSPVRKGRVIRARLVFHNPYVTDGTAKAIKYLLAHNAISQRLANKLLQIGAYAEPIGERAIAAGMRKLKHDGIIYNGGLDEIVDLR